MPRTRSLARRQVSRRPFSSHLPLEAMDAEAVSKLASKQQAPKNGADTALYARLYDLTAHRRKATPYVNGDQEANATKRQARRIYVHATRHSFLYPLERSAARPPTLRSLQQVASSLRLLESSNAALGLHSLQYARADAAVSCRHLLVPICRFGARQGLRGAHAHHACLRPEICAALSPTEQGGRWSSRRRCLWSSSSALL